VNSTLARVVSKCVLLGTSLPGPEIAVKSGAEFLLRAL
jgi:hypothetical protein